MKQSFFKKELQSMMNLDSENGIDKKKKKNLLAVVKEKKGIDFSDYAYPSLHRRISRFIEINRLSGFSELISKIKNVEGFADSFIHEITVNVTEMFRDPSFWVTLRDHVLPSLRNKPVISIWHAGCSMGEEVYSMAILLKEEKLLSKAKIVATDINMEALKKARNGIYLLKNQELNENNYFHLGGKGKLSEHYKIEGNMAQYDQELIKRVEFKRHDLSSDPYFGMFDMVICRNVFIYFNLSLQEKVLGVFSQSLNPGGFLGIGSKESVSWLKGARYFKPISIEDKVFVKV